MRLRALAALSGAVLALDLHYQVEQPTAHTADGRPVRLVAKGKVCGANTTEVGFVASAQQCAEAVVGRNDSWALYGLFFSYGAGVGTATAGQCAAIAATAETCPSGWVVNPDLDFYAVDTLGVDPPDGVNATCASFRLVRGNATCAALPTDLGTFGNVTACGLAAQASGGKFFSFGIKNSTGDGTCQVVGTTAADCPEGWAASSVASFYAIDLEQDAAPTWWVSQGNNTVSGAQGKTVKLARQGYTCASTDVFVGNMSLRACAAAVAAHGGRFIAYGPGLACRMELTAAVECPEGWVVEHAAGFYAVETIAPGLNVKELTMPPCAARLKTGIYTPQTVVSGTGRSMVRRGASPQLDPGVEALREARETRQRVVALRNGLLRGAKAHAAALAPQKKMDITGSREIVEEAAYELKMPKTPGYVYQFAGPGEAANMPVIIPTTTPAPTTMAAGPPTTTAPATTTAAGTTTTAGATTTAAGTTAAGTTAAGTTAAGTTGAGTTAGATTAGATTAGATTATATTTAAATTAAAGLLFLQTVAPAPLRAWF